MSKKKITSKSVKPEIVTKDEAVSQIEKTNRKEINGIEMREPESRNEIKWFSYIKKLVDAAPYGSVDIKMTVKGGRVTNIKVKSEESFSVHNS